MRDLEATKQGRPVILGFYADWYTSCQALDRNVFSDPEVLVWGEKLVTLRVDFTHRLAGQDKLLAR